MIHNDKVLEDVNALLDYDSVKDFLFMNVINAETNKEELSMEPHTVIGDLAIVYRVMIATVYKGNIIKNLIMDCQSYTKYRPNETTGGIFVSWRRKEELPTGA